MPFIKRLLRSLFNISVGPVLALVLVFEEWGWEPLQRVMARLARLPLWERMEASICRLPPYGALLVLCVPALLLFPIKLLALYWVGNGHVVTGLALVLVAKLVGTAAVARLFALTLPALMRLTWFARLYGHWKPWKDALIAQLKASPAWRAMQTSMRTVRASVRRLYDSLRS
jgi:hypothetical protein